MKELAELLLAAAKSPTVTWRVLLVVAFVAHVSWDYGWIPGVETAHASEADVKSAQMKIDRLLELGLVEQIERLLRYKCMHPTDGSIDQIVARLEAEYRDVTGDRYVRPSCEYLTDAPAPR